MTESQSFNGQWNIKQLHNKIINISDSIMRKESTNIGRKIIEDYSYSLSNVIGKGYSSQVYRGKNDNTNEQVAIKVIDVRNLKGEVHKNLLSAEIEILKILKRSAHIIELYDVYSTKNNTYIVTELCRDGDLSKTISQRTKLAEAEAIEIMKQIIQGYSQLYKNAIIHRDLKPANIFLNEGQTKIADFGFAMKAGEGKRSCSYNVGSPIYMPPQALNENKYSYKSDIWALGVIFYEMLTGKTPWKAKTEKDLGKLLINTSITKLIPPKLTQTSVDFLTRTLEVDYNRRMCPEELIRFIFDQTTQEITYHSSNIRRIHVNKPTQDYKNNSLPKTAATIAKPPEVSNNLIPINKKLLSKQLLSQVHFCRFLYKLLHRIDATIDHVIDRQLEDLKEMFWGLIFMKLNDVKDLKDIDPKVGREYQKCSDYNKIVQIVEQYEVKYCKELKSQPQNVIDLSAFQEQLSQQICRFYQRLLQQPQIQAIKHEIIILDYFVTLRQLISLMITNDLDGFHTKSKIQAIVEGQPASDINKEHLRAISAKLKAIHLI